MRGRPRQSCALAWPSPARWLPAVIVWLALLPSPSPAAAQHGSIPGPPRTDCRRTRSTTSCRRATDTCGWPPRRPRALRRVRFVVFDRSTPGIESQRVRALHQDRKGTLWAATEDGMLIRYQDARFVTYTSKDGLPHAGAVRIEEDDEGCLWVTWVGRITRFDGRRFVNLGAADFGNRVAVPPAARYHDAWWPRMRKACMSSSRGECGRIPNALIGAKSSGSWVDRRGNLWITPRRRCHQGVGRHGSGATRRATACRAISPDGRSTKATTATSGSRIRGNLYRVRNGKAELFRLPGAPFSGWRSFLRGR